MTTQDPSRRQFGQRVAGAVLTATGLAGLSTTASADDDPPRGLFADGLDLETDGPDQWAFLRGWFDSARTRSTRDAGTNADHIRSEFRGDSELWLAYGNWLLEEFDDIQPLGTATVQIDVVDTSFRGDVTDRVELALRGEYDDAAGQYDTLEMDYLESIDAEPDFQVQIADSDAEMAADELQRYRREHIDPDGDDHGLPDAEQASELAGRYYSALDFGPDSRPIVDVLLGEVRA